MRLYVDEDSVRAQLIRLLQRAGHDIEAPYDIGMNGYSDATQLRHSISARRAFLSANHDDFRELHELILASGGTHSGILIVRRDNDRRRDLTPRGVVAHPVALGRAEVPVENEFIILNHWR